MKKQLMASVLLAGMIFTVPGYADNELMSDGNDSYDKYKSPLEQSYGPIVNDRPKAESADDGEAFARVAGQLTQRTVSNIAASDQQADGKKVPVARKNNTASANETEDKESEQEAVSTAKKIALEKAGRQAEEILSETDDSFEADQDKEYPGYEYQARRQVKSSSDVEDSKDVLQQDHNTALKPAEIKSADDKGLSASDGDVKKTGKQAALAGNERKPVLSGCL